MTTQAPPVLDRRGEPLPVEALSRHWRLSGWRDVEALPGGKNDHFRVTAGAGTYFLRRSYRSKQVHELREQLDLMRLVAGRGLPVPLPVPTADGAAFALVQDRLWVVTRLVEGEPYDPARPAHLAALGGTVATYHRTVADLPVQPGDPALLVELRRWAEESTRDPWLDARAAEVVDQLTVLAPELPWTQIHGGARRGSLLFAGDRVVALLDLDSSRPDVRVLDLAVAAHDVGKVFTTRGAEDHKVTLDLTRVATLLDSYLQEGSLSAAEARALPLLIESKRLKRALGRLGRLRSGEPLSENDHAKIRLERRRLQWLDNHREELADLCMTRVNTV